MLYQVFCNSNHSPYGWVVITRVEKKSVETTDRKGFYALNVSESGFGGKKAKGIEKKIVCGVQCAMDVYAVSMQRAIGLGLSSGRSP